MSEKEDDHVFECRPCKKNMEERGKNTKSSRSSWTLMAETSSFAAGEGWNGFDDVDELPAELDDQFWEVRQFVENGNRAFRENRMDEAITYYSKAQTLKPGDVVILSNRSASFCRLSRILRDRPSSSSERQPLNGLDPTTHAELALKDAERVMMLSSNALKSYYLKANALMLLERYEEAREALLLGLQLDPLSTPLQVSLHRLEMISGRPSGSTRHEIPERTDDFECTLCFKLLYEPVTTPCGHSFCRACLFQSMDHGNKCPICRTVLFISPRTYPISVTLNNIIQKNFPEEYAERKLEHENLTCLAADLLPLFVMDVVLPCQKLSLNIFEPRYRLMVRRVMEGNHRMGMVVIDSSTGFLADYACEVEISEFEPLPDGRFYLEVEGRRRFHILRSWDQDGYRVAQVEWVQDSCPPEGTTERDDLNLMAAGAAELARTWIQRMKDAARTERLRRMDLPSTEGMPRPQDPERFSFWLVNLLNLRPSDRLELLRLRDTRERISRGLILLRAEEQGCRVQ